MEENEIIYSDVPLVEEQDKVTIEEVMPIIEVTEIESYEVEMQEAFPAAEGNTSYNHALLNNREINDAHPISAITGLRAELNAIEALKTVYSDKKGNADYYEWANGHLIDGVGYFVSLNKDVRTITICTGDDIFGVVVDNAAFVGGQDDVSRDEHYGLVATSGVVLVRCELDVTEGSYVVSNSYGIAAKAGSNCGYKVVAIHDVKGVPYAAIMLNMSANQIDSMGTELKELNSRMNAAESNIVSAVNAANLAYNKANEIEISHQTMSGKVESAAGKVEQMATDVENMGTQVSNSTLISTQAKAIAESAALYAESMKNEAVDKANESWNESVKLRNEFALLTTDINDKLGNSALEMQAVKDSLEKIDVDLQDNIKDAIKDLEELEKELEPLAIWPEGATVSDAKGIAGFVAKANENSATLASMAKFEGEFGQSLSGFIQEATKDNATVRAIANYQQKDADGNPYGPAGVSALIGQVDANKASIDALASLEGDGFSGLAGLTAQVDKNTSSVATLASHVVGEFENTDDWVEDGKDINKVYYAKNNHSYYYYKDGAWHSTTKSNEAGLNGALSGVQNIADANKAQFDAMASYDKDGNSALAGMTAYVDENSANFSELAKYSNKDTGNSGIAGLVADVDDSASTLSAVVNHQFTKNDGTTVSGLAGLNAYVNENESNVSLVSDRVSGKYIVLEEAWNTSDKDTNTVYYVKAATEDEKDLWYYYDGEWKNTEDPYEAGLPRAMAGIQAKTDDNSASIDSLTSWQDETDISMARIEQKADVNGAYIQSTVANMDKYAVGPYSQAYGFTLEQAANVLEEGMIYVPTVLKTGDNAEVYNYTDGEQTKTFSREFTPGYLYQWGELDGGLYGWITVDKNYKEAIEIAADNTKPANTSSMAVYFSGVEIIIGSENNYGYWYTNSDVIKDTEGNITDKYKPYTLYKWESYIGEDKRTRYHWVAVATLAGNSQNRAMSQIRQDANSISLEVSNTRGDVANITGRVDETESDISSLTSWKNGEETSEGIIRQTSNNNGSAITISTYQKNDDGGIVEQASLVLNVAKDSNGNSTSALLIDADNIKFTGQKLDIKVDSTNIDGTLTIGQLPETVAKTSDIPTKISALENDSGFQNRTGVVEIVDGYITADYIETLGLEVGNQIAMGNNAKISWDNVDSKPSVATTTQVDEAKTAAINSAVSEVENKGYQTASQVTEITKNTIRTETITATNVRTGTLESQGYTENSSGFKIDLDEGTIDSPHFKVDNDGFTTVDKGAVGGWTLNEQMLTADDDGTNSNYGYKVGLYSGSDYLEDSLLGVGVKSPIRFFCGSLDEEKKDLTTCTFCVLADGSLFASAALFFGENVMLDSNVRLGGGGQTVGSMVDNINRIPGNISQLYNDLGFVTRSQVQQMIDDALNNSSNDPTPSVIWKSLAGLNGTVYDPEVEEGEDASFTVECPSDNSSVLRIKTNAPFNTIKITLASSNIVQGINCSVQSDTKSYEYDFEPNASNRTITFKIQNNLHDDDYANTEFYVTLLKNNGYFTVNWIHGVELSYDHNVNTTQND